MPCAAMNHFPTYLRRSGGIVFVITLVLSGLVDPIVGEPTDAGTHGLHAGPCTAWLYSW